MGVSEWMFLLVPADPGSPGQRVVKRLCVESSQSETAKKQQLDARCLHELINWPCVHFRSVASGHQLTSQLCADMHRLRRWTFPDICKCRHRDCVCLVCQQWANRRQLTIVHSHCWPGWQRLVSIQSVVDVVTLYSIDRYYISQFNHRNVTADHARYLQTCCHVLVHKLEEYLNDIVYAPRR